MFFLPKINFNLATKCLLLSFLIHLIISQIFVFILPSKKFKIRPSFIFLGSVLKENDFSAKNKTSAASNYSEKLGINTPGENPFTNFSLNKPGALLDSTEKKPNKITFDTKDIEKNIRQENADVKPALQFELAPYEPLTLGQND